MEPHYSHCVHWDVTNRPASWQLQRRNRLRVDIVDQFDSKFLLTAIRGLSDQQGNILKELMRDKVIPATQCGAGGFSGTCDTIFDFTDKPGHGWGWHVTNDALEFPALRAGGVSNKILNMRVGDDFCNHVTRNPNEGITVQFENVPWTIFTRYWRKPMNLDKPFHGSRKHGFITTFPAIDVLHFDPKMMRKYKIIIADFNRSGTVVSHTIRGKWMLENAKKFSVMSDNESPFVRDTSEFLFITDWLSRLPR